MTTYWVHTPKPTMARDLVARCNFRRGTVVVRARVSCPNLRQVLDDISEVCGVDPEMTRNRSIADAEATAVTRLKFWEVRHVVIVNASDLSAAATNAVAQFADDFGLTFWLTYEYPEHFLLERMTRANAPQKSFQECLEAINLPATTYHPDRGRPSGKHCTDRLPRLPSDSVLNARHLARTQFNSEQKSVFDRHYEDAYRRALGITSADWVAPFEPVRESRIWTLLMSQWRICDCPEVAVTRTIAVQAALLTLGWNVTVSTQAIRNMVSALRHRRATPGELARLYALPDHVDALLIGLVATGTPIHTATTLVGSDLKFGMPITTRPDAEGVKQLVERARIEHELYDRYPSDTLLRTSAAAFSRRTARVSMMLGIPYPLQAGAKGAASKAIMLKAVNLRNHPKWSGK